MFKVHPPPYIGQIPISDTVWLICRIYALHCSDTAHLSQVQVSLKYPPQSRLSTFGGRNRRFHYKVCDGDAAVHYWAGR
ncbi:hypothetical protein XELAEV_18038799mg [Xenopus laevis]|uniref:Uncharacterized protein n=1 Tax=Xenopus laevis TaxID=8355 RepID=A0A974H7R8_XENLA|nr:hypothetical protein XELAEV_18038799mg [Xenopus laevis]